jgi:uncharacterized membrane protein
MLPVSTPTPPPQNPQQPLPPGKPGKYSVEVAFAGPLPPPQILQGYEAACPGAAHRIIEMAEAQSAHRRDMERMALQAQCQGMNLQFFEARLGQCFAFGISALFLICGTITVVHGDPIPGSIFGTMGISGIVATFIHGRSAKPEAEPQKIPPKSENKRKPARR